MDMFESNMARSLKTDYSSLMHNRIMKILMICSSYDAFILEEDGQIESEIYKEYNDLNLSSPPSVTWVNSSSEAENLLSYNKDFDLIICMFNIRDLDFFTFARSLKSNIDIPIVLLSNYSREFFDSIEKTDLSVVDYVFTWNGNADLIIAIIKLIEDKMNAERDILEFGVQCILLVEDSIRFYSTYLPAIYKLVLKQSAEFLTDALNEQQMRVRKRARPKMLLATNYEDALNYYNKYKSNLLGVISDVAFVLHKNDPPESEKLDAGLELCRMIRKDDPQMPIILQSSQESIGNIAKEMGIGFIKKYSKTLLINLSAYISEEFAFGDFVVRDIDTKEIIAKAGNLKELQSLIKATPDRELSYHAFRDRFSKWLYSRGIFSLAERFKSVDINTFKSVEDGRNWIIQQIKEYRILTGQGIIAEFNKNLYNKYIWFAKMGSGSLGGKARGLAFLNNMIVKYDLFSRYDRLKVTIPRSVVVATDYFDQFITENGLQYVIDSDITDEELLSEFVSSRLPVSLVEELKVFISTISDPLAIRSSSKLEDSQFQPFAGIYSTYMIPYTENSDQMFRLVSKAIKSVYASVFFGQSRAYMLSTANMISEEKMAVIIQGVCGSEDQGYYFPTISGVARSINFYPLFDEKQEDGIVNMALGLGKIVVDGGSTLRFSPKYPKKILQLSTIPLMLNETQSNMYALNLKPEEFKTSIDDAVNLEKFSIQEASRFKNMKYVASTWDPLNQRVIPNTFEEGRRIVTFASILEYDTLPVARIIDDLLTICKNELRCDVEVEFAIDLDESSRRRNRQFSILQVRPIAEYAENTRIDLNQAEGKEILISANSALGSGSIDGITDVIYVKSENFDKSKTFEIAQEIGSLNMEMRSTGRNFILIGPGRWGSSDPWLGIPVAWNQISQAKVIVECGIEELHVEPSQGTHFFQNITSLGVGYFTITPFIGDGKFNSQILDSMESDYDSEYIRRVPMNGRKISALIDSKRSKGVIFLY